MCRGHGGGLGGVHELWRVQLTPAREPTRCRCMDDTARDTQECIASANTVPTQFLYDANRCPIDEGQVKLYTGRGIWVGKVGFGAFSAVTSHGLGRAGGRAAGAQPAFVMAR